MLKTGFVAPYGHYEYTKILSGLIDAPKAFQRVISSILSELPFARVFLDDILIFSRTEHEHVDHIREVVNRLKNNNITLNVWKCTFMSGTVIFLGHVITNEGAQPDISKIQGLTMLPEPTTGNSYKSY